MKWIVQEFHPSPGRARREGIGHDGRVTSPYGCWIDVLAEPPGWDWDQRPWEAETADAALGLAVLSNPKHEPNATKYRVLPFDGGVTTVLSMNVDTRVHCGEHGTS